MPRISHKYIICTLTLQFLFFSPLLSYNASSIHHREGLSARLARQTQDLSLLLMDEENPSNIIDDFTVPEMSLPTHNIVIDEFRID